MNAYILPPLFTQHFYVNENAQKTGEHEVHREHCAHGKRNSNFKFLSSHNANEAMNEAKLKYYIVDGCYWCMNEYHSK